MKKPAAIALATTVLLTMAGCTPQLSTSETCVELRAITSGMGSSPTDEQQKKILDNMDKLAGRASDTLKEPIRDASFMNRELLKPVADQDKTKLNDARRRVQSSADMVKETCNL